MNEISELMQLWILANDKRVIFTYEEIMEMEILWRNEDVQPYT